MGEIIVQPGKEDRHKLVILHNSGRNDQMNNVARHEAADYRFRNAAGCFAQASS
jgi:hypothetical protein